MELNKIPLDRHQLVQADCLTWLQEDGECFDLIVLDPPSFSNSKRMIGILDIQRDHVELVQRCMRRLNPGGTLYFSTNRRRFRLADTMAQDFVVSELGSRSLDADFSRGSAHRCWRLQHGKTQC